MWPQACKVISLLFDGSMSQVNILLTANNFSKQKRDFKQPTKFMLKGKFSPEQDRKANTLLSEKKSHTYCTELP